MKKQKIIITILVICLVLILGYIKVKKEIKEISYYLHENVSVTVFWVGEEANSENNFISNVASAWNDEWLKNSVDENEFYFALPYNDFDEEGKRKADVKNIIYWANEKEWAEDESMLKNKWIEVIYKDNICYAQWEDVGPFGEDDINYVFGEKLPLNKINEDAGLDVSPAVRDCLGIEDIDKVSWKFVDFRDVPDGFWKGVVTTSGVNWN